MKSYKVLKGQAGNRIIIRHKELNRPLTCTSHYANIEEFLTLKKNIEWYQVNGGKKVYLETKGDWATRILKSDVNNKGQASTLGIVGLVYLGLMLVVLLTIF